MAREISVGNLLVNQHLPEDLRADDLRLDKKGTQQLFRQIAEKYPERYQDILHALSTLGSDVAYREGATIGVSGLLDPEGKREEVEKIRREIATLRRDRSLDPKQRNQKITDLLLPFRQRMQQLAEEAAKREDDPLYLQARSGARGSVNDINLMRGSDAVAIDANDQPIPVPILRSYGAGQDPEEYWAGTFSQRKGQIGVKLSVADAGFTSKQLVNAMHRQVVTSERPKDHRLPVGLPIKTSDQDNVGAVLAKQYGDLKPGTVLTARMLKQLEQQGHDEILIHSPITDITEDGGLSAWAAGRRTRTGLAQMGDTVGITAGQALGERMAQGMLNAKHNQSVGQGVSKGGFEYLNRLLQGPEEFPESGPLAEKDGTVDKVEEAPQGGTYIWIDGHQHYAGPGIKPLVKAGQTVEAGDDLTDGTPHPADLVRLRGLGEARRVYLGLLHEGIKGSGLSAHRRNLENVSAGILNWAQVTDPDGIGDHLVDDLVPVGRLMAQYKPRPDAKLSRLNETLGQYLEEPALNYTVGTKVNRRVLAQLKRHGIEDLMVHTDPPGFEPHFQRAMMSLHQDPDWQVRLGGFYTGSAFQQALQRGLETDPDSTSFMPALADPETLGKPLAQTGHFGQRNLAPVGTSAVRPVKVPDLSGVPEVPALPAPTGVPPLLGASSGVSPR